MQKKIVSFLCILLLISCESNPVKTVVPGPKEVKFAPPENNSITISDLGGEESETEVSGPKLGLILGPGGAKALAHIAVLHELKKNKIPIWHLTGIEWGAFVGGLYAASGKTHQTEWKSLRLPNKEKFADTVNSTAKPQRVSVYSDFLRSTFKSLRLEKAKVPFSCPTISKGKKRLMTRGRFRDIVKYCWPHQPLFEVSNIYSAPDTIGYIARKLKEKGASVVVLVNVLSGSDLPSSNQWAGQWEKIYQQIAKFPVDDVDEVINLNLSNFKMSDLEKGREMIRSSRAVAKDEVQRLLKAYGF